MSKHYILQYNRYHGDKYTKWENLSREYDTFEEAEAARLKMPAPNCYRVAESYTVVRYKAVRKEEKRG